MGYSLIIDTGTSSMRGVIFDRTYKIVYKVQKRYFMSFSEPMSAEQDADVYRQSMEYILRECSAFVEKEGGKIKQIALTAQRSSVVPLDQKGKPISKVVMWYDKRSQKICDEINDRFGKEIYDTTGMWARPMFSAPKMRWIKDNRPEIYEKTYKLAGIQDYLIFLLTERWVTDLTFASRTNLLDLKKSVWSPRMLEIFQIDKKKLCSLISPGERVGYLKKQYHAYPGFSKDTEVYSAGGDQQCSLVGQGIFHDTLISITNGTASYVAVSMKEPVFDENRVVHINAGAVPGTWIAEASNMGTGSVYDWLRNLLFEREDSIEQMNQTLNASSLGAHGVYAFPYIAGKGMPDWDPNKWGAILNMRLSTTKSDVARAVLEGIAFEVSECFKRVETLTGARGKVRSSGGISALPLFDQMLADMTGRRVVLSSERETTALGAFIVLMLATGQVDREDIPEIIPENSGREFVPDSKNGEKYRKLYRKRKQIEKSIPFQMMNIQEKGGR